MHEVTEATLLKRARDAAAQSDWQQAYELFVQADASQLLDGPDLALFAQCAYAAGHVDATIDAWERVHAEGLRADDRLMAAGAAVRVALHLLFDTALLAPIRGWATRAERLLEGQDDTPVHAWLAVVRSYERLLSGDFAGARQWARRAIDVGTGRDPAAAALGRVAEARSLILEGEVARGLDLLNEAAVATVSGELDPLSTGVVYCEVVCALQAIAQYDLAEEWTQAMERWRHGQPVGSIHGRCRVHRAEILRLRGSCLEAEQEALQACEELRPYLRREFGWPLTELGRIRLRKGDIDGAEQAFLAAHQAGWDPQPGLALVRLAQGDVPLAVALIREALDHPSNVPSKELPPNSDLRRAPLLEAQVEIEIAAGDLHRAQSAADELARVAAVFESKALAAGAALALGQVRLAAGDAAGARRDFEAAAHQWGEIGAPYETARGRMGLAHAHRAEGNEAHAILEFRAAHAAFERIGAASQAARAADAIGEMPRDEIRASTSQTRPTVASSAHRDAGECLPARRRVLVGGLRRTDRTPARYEGCTVPGAAARQPGTRVPRRGSCWRRARWHLPTRLTSPSRVCDFGMLAMPARCSIRARRRRTAGGSPRLRTIWRRREHWGMHHGWRRQRPNATSSRASCRAPSDSEDAIDASVRQQNAPEPV